MTLLRINPLKFLGCFFFFLVYNEQIYVFLLWLRLFDLLLLFWSQRGFFQVLLVVLLDILILIRVFMLVLTVGRVWAGRRMAFLRSSIRLEINNFWLDLLLIHYWLHIFLLAWVFLIIIGIVISDVNLNILLFYWSCNLIIIRLVFVLILVVDLILHEISSFNFIFLN